VDASAAPISDPYINRELSALEFTGRVLDQAADLANPVLERLRFLCISCTNLDEFFEIRVAALKQRLELGAPAPGPDRLTPQQLIDEIRQRSLLLVNKQYKLLNETIFPGLAAESIRFLLRNDWSKAQRRWLKNYAQQEPQLYRAPRRKGRIRQAEAPGGRAGAAFPAENHSPAGALQRTR
jgi:polyphosphate kinase